MIQTAFPGKTEHQAVPWEGKRWSKDQEGRRPSQTPSPELRQAPSPPLSEMALFLLKQRFPRARHENTQTHTHQAADRTEGGGGRKVVSEKPGRKEAGQTDRS